MKYLIVLFILSTPLYAGEYIAQITKVHDGDTVTATIKLGLNVQVVTDIRLRGINAPELKTGKPGQLSTERLKELVLDKEVVVLTNNKKEFEKYGRVLGVIMINGIDVNETMVKEGFAIKYME